MKSDVGSRYESRGDVDYLSCLYSGVPKIIVDRGNGSNFFHNPSPFKSFHAIIQRCEVTKHSNIEKKKKLLSLSIKSFNNQYVFFSCLDDFATSLEHAFHAPFEIINNQLYFIHRSNFFFIVKHLEFRKWLLS